MRLGVISDTHVSSIAELPERVVEALKEVDIIIHAGDFVVKEVLDGLKRIGEVRAVCGNMDSAELKEFLPEKELLEIEGKKVGIIHGWGSPYGIDDRVGQEFSGVDIIIYGHSHYPQNESRNGVLFFNPGSARFSFGILTIGTEVKGEIIKL
jgi:putative phosphoesterase